jgi:hypothetical protein
LVPLPGLGWGEVAEDFVFAQAATVIERLDEGEDLGAASGPVWPDATADLFFEQGPERHGEPAEDVRGARAARVLATIDLIPLRERLTGVDITVACDVANPLGRPTGATAVWAAAPLGALQQLLDGPVSLDRRVLNNRRVSVKYWPELGE